ncbi:acyl carrier protein [Rugamonas sp. CCM 8940]|uniref:acyl carrier protein n=2 Tax=Rugamonas sp. CCM 8940 TaxID=2765359 RepID=UPI00361A6789
MSMLEQGLRDVLAQLIEVDPQQLSVTVNLSEQGVDSLLGLRFARKIEDLTGSPVELEWLFDYPTIRQLAGFLEQRAATSAAVPSV